MYMVYKSVEGQYIPMGIIKSLRDFEVGEAYMQPSYMGGVLTYELYEVTQKLLIGRGLQLVSKRVV